MVPVPVLSLSVLDLSSGCPGPVPLSVALLLLLSMALLLALTVSQPTHMVQPDVAPREHRYALLEVVTSQWILGIEHYSLRSSRDYAVDALHEQSGTNSTYPSNLSVVESTATMAHRRRSIFDWMVKALRFGYYLRRPPTPHVPPGARVPSVAYAPYLPPDTPFPTMAPFPPPPPVFNASARCVPPHHPIPSTYTAARAGGGTGAVGGRERLGVAPPNRA